MSALFILGNGFDLAHAMPTKYSDFRKELIRNYPDAETYKNSLFDLDAFLEMTEDEFSAEVLLSVMDLASGEEVTLSIAGRHDPCIVHRARAVVDSAVALTLCDMLALRYGTDWLRAE